jgi:hypothetical protein
MTAGRAREQVDISAGLRVEAVVVLILLEDLADDNGTILARVDRDLAGRPGQRLSHDLDAGLLVVKRATRVFRQARLAPVSSRRT